MNWNFTECGRSRHRLSLLAADALEGTERTELEAHVDSCSACHAQLGELQCLVDQCEQLGTNLPEALPSPDLRPRWRSAVLASTSTENEKRSQGSRPGGTSGRPFLELPAWLTGRRAAWGSLAMVWMVILLLNLSAPNAPKSAFASSSPSLREVLLVLKNNSLSGPKPHGTGKRPKPPGEQPRSERHDDRPATMVEAA